MVNFYKQNFQSKLEYLNEELGLLNKLNTRPPTYEEDLNL
jgi:hypothetical protein